MKFNIRAKLYAPKMCAPKEGKKEHYLFRHEWDMEIDTSDKAVFADFINWRIIKLAGFAEYFHVVRYSPKGDILYVAYRLRSISCESMQDLCDKGWTYNRNVPVKLYNLPRFKPQLILNLKPPI